MVAHAWPHNAFDKRMDEMDETERLLRVLEDAGSEMAWKLDALLDLDRLDDIRIVPRMLHIMAAAQRSTAVRIAVLHGVTERKLTVAERTQVARTVAALLRDRVATDAELRRQAALALAELTDRVECVHSLGAAATDISETFEVRYAAFTSLQRAGPTPQCLALLSDIHGDETLGPAAQGVLRSWRAV